MSSGDLECVALMSEVLFPLYQEWLEAFIGQFSAEYAVDAMSVFETAESQTARHPFRSPAVVRWKHEFLNSNYGSRYQNLETVAEARCLLSCHWKERSLDRGNRKSPLGALDASRREIGLGPPLPGPVSLSEFCVF
ncbi:hypothetical protein DFH09DRAFT_1076325 [Mycena vulgaris]|nr:hypothetical protein DFH09DRAFT_1076325 [Mycena vulgaris]